MMPALSLAPSFTGSMYEQHVHDVARWAERLAGPSLDVEDIVHEVFTVAIERAHKFRGDSTLKTWLFGITDLVVRHRRRKERWRRWLSGSAVETAGHLMSESPDPLRLMEHNEEVTQAYAVLDRLPDRYRQILILSDMEELDVEEVAQLLGISLVNTRVRLHRARAYLTRAYREMVKKHSRRDSHEPR